MDLLPRGGQGDLRNTLNSRPVTSLSSSQRPTRSMGGCEPTRCCSSEQRGDGAFDSSSVDPGALIEDLLQRGGQGDLRNTRALRPATSLSDSHRPTRLLEGFVLKQPCSSKQRGDVKQRRSRRKSGVRAGLVLAESSWVRARRCLSVVSSMVLGAIDDRLVKRTDRYAPLQKRTCHMTHS